MTFHRPNNWTALVAAIALLSAQLLLASHEIKHFWNADQGSCEVCLTATALGSPVPASSQAFFPDNPASPVEQSLNSQPAQRLCFCVHPARAPPTPTRI